MINVVNKKDHTPTSRDYYIGRGSLLGNPFSHNPNAKIKDNRYLCETREESIKRFRKYIEYHLKPLKDSDDEYARKTKKDVRKALNEIYRLAKSGGVNLVCYCKPEPCHGDVIREVVNDRLYYTEEDKLVNFLSRNEMVEKLIDKFDLVL